MKVWRMAIATHLVVMAGIAAGAATLLGSAARVAAADFCLEDNFDTVVGKNLSVPGKETGTAFRPGQLCLTDVQAGDAGQCVALASVAKIASSPSNVPVP